MKPRPSLPERIRLYLEKLPAAIAGSGGHAKTFDAAFTLVKGFALSVDDARPFLSEFNARCLPPWSEKELEHKLQSADRVPDRQGRKSGWLVGSTSAADPAAPKSTMVATAPGPAIELAFDPAKLASFAAEWQSRVSLCWLANRSPIEPALVAAEDFLSLLYG